MDNTSASQSNATGDYFSLVMTTLYITLGFIEDITKSQVTFWLTVFVGGSTFLYNAIKIAKEFQKPK